MCINAAKLPEEFKSYDSTRIYYMVITGLRDHYNGVTYRLRRTRAKNDGIDIYHYDDLIDLAKGLENKNTF